MDWLFLSQIFILILFWHLTGYLYRHPKWLYSSKNNPININITSFPTLSYYLEKIVNSNGFIYVTGILVFIPAIFCGLVFVGYFIIVGVSELFEFIALMSYWKQLFFLVYLITFYWGCRFVYDLQKGKSFLSAKEDPNSRFSKKVNQKISDIDASRIQTYPRFTLYDINEEEKRRKLIFDSSDFSVINESFGIFDSYNGKTIINGSSLTFREKEYLIVKVQVDFLSIFDDYSYVGHTSIYEGNNVPYNIQIIIDAKQEEGRI